MNSSLPVIWMSRWLAALVVVMYHLRYLLFADYSHLQNKTLGLSLFYFVTSIGHECFVLYMVASGVLLGGLSYRRWQRDGARAWPDLSRRATRFYLLLVPALAVGGLIDLAGSHGLAESAVYTQFPQFAPSHLSLPALLGNLLMLQGFAVPCFGSNAMLVLLAFECWAFLIFALPVLFASTRGRAFGLVAGCALALAGTLLTPEFPGYLLLWLAGAWTVARVPRLPLAPAVAAGLFVAAVLLSRIGGAHLAALPASAIPAARVALDLLLGLGFLAMLLAVHGRRWCWPRAFARMSRRMDRLSLAVLALHFPPMMLLVAAASTLFAIPLVAQPSLAGCVLFALVVGAVYAYSWAFARMVQGLARWGRQMRRVVLATYAPR